MNAKEQAFLIYSPVAPLALYTYANGIAKTWTASASMPLSDQLSNAALMFRTECPNAEEIHVPPIAIPLERAFNDTLVNQQFAYKPVKFISD